LKIGSTSIWKLEKNLWEKRQTLIYSLKKLISRGFVNFIQTKNFPVYSAVWPEIIEYEFKEKQKVMENCISELKNIHNKETFNTKVKFYPSDQIENLFVELTKERSYYVITNLDYTITHRKTELIEYRKRRMYDESIKTNIITFYTEEVWKFLEEYWSPIWDNYKFIDKNKYDFNINLEILENKVLILSIDPNEKYWIIIESKWFLESQKALFETLWNK